MRRQTVIRANRKTVVFSVVRLDAGVGLGLAWLGEWNAEDWAETLVIEAARLAAASRACRHALRCRD